MVICTSFYSLIQIHLFDAGLSVSMLPAQEQLCLSSLTQGHSGMWMNYTTDRNTQNSSFFSSSLTSLHVFC